ncbi:MAG: type I glyceraldehyde-3-phosphate dehydrogenase [Acidobacteriota bacterium]
MTTTPFAINGFGRIGRALARVAQERSSLELVAINDLAEPALLAHLLERDSVHGRFPGRVEVERDAILLEGRRVEVFREPEPQKIPWQTTEARAVVEATGALRADRATAAAGHLRLEGGPRRVLVSAIAPDADLMLCPGIRGPHEERLHAPDVRVISHASCTSHCLALLIDVLDRAFGVERAMMNEIHSYTGNQSLVDGVNPDARRARAAAINIVPTFTAAPQAVERVMPHLAGRLSGMAVRVPTPNVALLELYATLGQNVDRERVLESFRAAEEDRLAGLLGVSDQPLVSSDYLSDPRSAVVDSEWVQASDGQCRVLAWYDNEWGYTHRLADLLERLDAPAPAQRNSSR